MLKLGLYYEFHGYMLPPRAGSSQRTSVWQYFFSQSCLLSPTLSGFLLKLSNPVLLPSVPPWRQLYIIHSASCQKNYRKGFEEIEKFRKEQCSVFSLKSRLRLNRITDETIIFLCAHKDCILYI